MIAGFVIWSAVSLVLLGIGIQAWHAKKAVGFYSGVRPPEVRDVTKYNHSVAILWMVYAALFELLGLPFLFQKQNAVVFLCIVPGVAFISIGLCAAYHRILQKYRQGPAGRD